MGLAHDISREFIAVPDGAKQQILYKWRDNHIRRWTKAIVDADEQAVFIAQGRVLGTLGPGRHTIDATELPFIGDVIDKLTGGDAYNCELFFVSTREFPDLPFGGAVDAVRDPQTQLVVQLRGYGQYSLQVADPIALILRLTGTVDVADATAVIGWVADQVMKAARTVVVTHVTQDAWPVLGIAAHTPEIETGTLAAANAVLAGYGLEVTRLGNVTINLTDEDAEQLRALARATAYTSLAGSFGAYAQGEALLGAAQGMAKGQGGGEALGIAALGVGAGLLGGTSALGGVAQVGAAATRGAAGFCSQCGHGLEPAARFCSSCGHPVAHGAQATPEAPDQPPAS